MRAFALLALMGSFVVASAQDKVNLVHDQSEGRKLSYVMTFGGSQGELTMKLTTAFDLAYGAKQDGLTATTITPTSFRVKMGENESDQPTMTGALNLMVDAFGMPKEVSTQGPEFLMAMFLLMSYLPNKELSVGDSFSVAWKTASAEFSGEGKLIGIDQVEGKPVARLEVKSSLKAGEGEAGQLAYVVSYDSTTKAILKTDGTATVGDQKFDISVAIKQ